MALTLSSAARLASPNFGNIEQLGQDIGSLSARRRQRGMLADLMAPLMSGDASQTDYSNAAVQLAQMGDLDRAVQVSQLGQNVGANRRALREQMTQDQLAINEEASLKRLKSNAISTLQRRAEIESDPVKKQKIINGLMIARTSRDRETLENLIAGRSLSLEPDFRVTGEYTQEDEAGNEWSISIRQDINDPSAEPIRSETLVGASYIPEVGGSPQKRSGTDTPVGATRIVSDTSGISGEDRSVIQREIDASREYLTLKAEAIAALSTIEGQITDAQKSLSLLDDIKTGGFDTALVRQASDFFGVTPKDEAQFNLLAGQAVLAGLSAFTGAISEGERNYLESLFQDLERSEGANRGILELMLERAEFNLRDAQAKAKSDSFDEYMQNRPTRVGTTAQPEEVSWNSLTK
tara:strand:- start:2061 stop:3284 length:1224 start_codon:yes stop_codon:yes gene_type:complete